MTNPTDDEVFAFIKQEANPTVDLNKIRAHFNTVTPNLLGMQLGRMWNRKDERRIYRKNLSNGTQVYWVTPTDEQVVLEQQQRQDRERREQAAREQALLNITTEVATSSKAAYERYEPETASKTAVDEKDRLIRDPATGKPIIYNKDGSVRKKMGRKTTAARMSGKVTIISGAEANNMWDSEKPVIAATSLEQQRQDLAEELSGLSALEKSQIQANAKRIISSVLPSALPVEEPYGKSAQTSVKSVSEVSTTVSPRMAVYGDTQTGGAPVCLGKQELSKQADSTEERDYDAETPHPAAKAMVHAVAAKASHTLAVPVPQIKFAAGLSLDNELILSVNGVQVILNSAEADLVSDLCAIRATRNKR